MGGIISAPSPLLCGLLPGMPIEVLDEPLSLRGARGRTNEFGHEQFLISDVLSMVSTHERVTHRSHVYIRLGITFEDLYPDDPSFKFISGQGEYKERVGVFSFARRSPVFNQGVAACEAASALTRSQLLDWVGHIRNTMAHELCHMLGMKHCVFLHCLMNGLSGLQDSNCGMNLLCPICLRKLLHILTGVNARATLASIRMRYSKLADVLLEMVRDADGGGELPSVQHDILWLQERVRFIDVVDAPGALASHSAADIDVDSRHEFVYEREEDAHSDSGLEDFDPLAAAGEPVLTQEQKSELAELGWYRKSSEHKKDKEKKSKLSKTQAQAGRDDELQRSREEAHQAAKLERAAAEQRHKERQAKKLAEVQAEAEANKQKKLAKKQAKGRKGSAGEPQGG